MVRCNYGGGKLKVEKIMEYVKVSLGMNRQEQLRSKGRFWNRTKIFEAQKKNKLDKIRMKELKEGYE